jgi:hypothetical protein|tara:strand:+ start:121 stop:381 length:261 start_codon:yes stop_codon:yes gene_type:complete
LPGIVMIVLVLLTAYIVDMRIAVSESGEDVMQPDLISFLLVVSGAPVIFRMAEQTRRSLAAKGGEDGVINALSWPWRLMLRATGRA